MPTEADADLGRELIEDDAIQLNDLGAGEEPTSAGGMRYIDGSFSFRDSDGLFDPRMDADSHKDLDQLVHEIAETCYYEITYSSGKVSVETWWTNSGKTTKIREINYTYSGQTVTQEVQTQYDSTGSLVTTLTLSYTYSGSKIQSVTYTES